MKFKRLLGKQAKVGESEKCDSYTHAETVGACGRVFSINLLFPNDSKFSMITRENMEIFEPRAKSRLGTIWGQREEGEGTEGWGS